MPVDSAVPTDHLGVEIKFLSFLCHNETGAWRTGKTEDAVRLLRQQSSFLDKHLLSWVPEYLAMLRMRSRHPLYRNSALLTLKMITEHGDSCKQILRQPGKKVDGASSVSAMDALA